MYQTLKTPQSTLLGIPEGVPGVKQTLYIMSRLTRAGKKNPAVRQAALDIRGSALIPQKDYVGEVKALFDFVQNRINYVRDIRGVETVQTPQYTLENAQGDCDDKSVLLASLLESIGHPTRFVAVGFKPGVFSHVLVETKIGQRWLSLETTEPVAMGWYPPNVVTRYQVDN